MKNNTPTIEKFIKQGLIEGLGVEFLLTLLIKQGKI